MYIYHLKLSNGCSYNHAVSGNFSGYKKSEVIVSRNTILELLIIKNDGEIVRHTSKDLKIKIRSVAVVKFKDRDFVAIGSDSGHALIVAYNDVRNTFVPIFKQKYGMPVTLPECPGQYVAASSLGIAIGSLVENHIFYGIYKPEDVGKNEPLRVNQPKCIIYDLVGIEQTNRIARFASLEVLCEEKVKDPDNFKQYLKVYDADFDTRKVSVLSEALPQHGNMLVSVPKGENHPHGVVICYPNELFFYPFEKGFNGVAKFLPQRKFDAFNAKRGFLLTSSAIIEEKGNHVILMQSEQGDLFSVRIYKDKNKKLAMKIIYMDTIPVASAMCVVSGRLFVAAEFGDNFLYDIKSFGNESEMIPHTTGGDRLVKFCPRKLKSLSITRTKKSISPIMQSYVSDFACNDLKTFIFACGRGPSSTLRLQRYGVKVSTVYETKLPPLSNAVWSVNQEIEDRSITHILVSLMGRTMVLTLDQKLKIDYGSAFCSKVPTLGCTMCTRDSIIQVNPMGIRHIKNNRFSDKKIDFDKKDENGILLCALYGRQIALALVSKEGMYFEVEDTSEEVIFHQMEAKTAFKSTVMCMEFIPKEIKAQYLVVCFEDSLEIYSVDLQEMKCRTTHDFKGIPVSLGISSKLYKEEETSSIINIGFNNGVLQRIALNEEKIKSEYSLKLGNKAVKLSVGRIKNQTVVLALTNRAWICFHNYDALFTLAPLDFDQMHDFAFISASCSPSANLLAISKKIVGSSCVTKLYFLSVDDKESMIEDNCARLTYTPKVFSINPKNNFIIISETDKSPPNYKVNEITPQLAMDLTLDPSLKPPVQSLSKPHRTVFNSLLHIYDPTERKTIVKESPPENMSITSMSLVEFGKGPQYLLVGAQLGNIIGFSTINISKETNILTYEVSSDGKTFKFVNKTVAEDIISAISPIESCVLIGIGKLLCLYDFKHKSKTLSRCFIEEALHPIQAIWSRKNFFVVETVDELLTYGYLETTKTSFVLIHQDRFMRGVSCLCFWDDDVIFVGDRQRISAVMLPYYEGCNDSPPATEEIQEALQKMKISDQISSTFQPAEQLHEAGPSNYKAGPFFPCSSPAVIVGLSYTAGPSTSKASSSSQAGPSTSKTDSPFQGGTTFKIKAREAKAGTSSQATTQPTETECTISDASSSQVKHSSPIDKAEEEEEIYNPSFLRFMKYSYVLVTHKVGEYVRCIQKTSLIKEGSELIVYTTLSGAVGILVPHLTETPHKFFGPLEYLIVKTNPLYATEWLNPLNPDAEGIYSQCCDDQVVIDGNTCELYATLSKKEQKAIASEMGTSNLEILQKIEELRASLFIGSQF